MTLTPEACAESLRGMHRDFADGWPADAFAEASQVNLAALVVAEAEVDRLAAVDGGPTQPEWDAALQALALAMMRIRREAVERLRGGG